MSDAARTIQFGSTFGDSEVPEPLTPQRIDAIVDDFRTWLTRIAEAPPEPTPPEPPRVDLQSLIAQFTALRHEVNMQTKAARTAVEQNAEALKLLEQSAKASTAPKEASDPQSTAFAKTLIEIIDALSLGSSRVDEAIMAMEPLLEAIAVDHDAGREPVGLLARLFGNKKPAPHEGKPELEKLRSILNGLSDGYVLSLRRVEKLLPQFGLEPIECDGEDFDPETMEAVEVTDAPGADPGTVAEEVRKGWLRNGELFRCAQVKIAR